MCIRTGCKLILHACKQLEDISVRKVVYAAYVMSAASTPTDVVASFTGVHDEC
jgi:hypothetical protein